MHRTAVHIVGESDIGLEWKHNQTDRPRETKQRLADLRSLDPGRWTAELAGNPIAHFVDALLAPDAGPNPIANAAPRPDRPRGDRILLITTNGGNERDTVETGEFLAEYVRARTSAAARATSAGSVPAEAIASIEVVELREPSIEAGRHWTRTYLAERSVDPAEPWRLPLGGGSTGLLLGILFELLVTGAPMSLHSEDGSPEPIPLAAPTTDASVRRWLVRHRFYTTLERLDADHRGVESRWTPLARRQAVNVDALLDAAGCQRRPDGTWPLTDEARGVLFEAVTASFFEGMARGEITDGAAARTWLKRYVWREAPSAELREKILAHFGFPPKPAAQATEPAAELAAEAELDQLGPALRTLINTDDAAEVAVWRKAVTSISHGDLAPFPEPPSAVRRLQEKWIEAEHRDVTSPLTDYPAWPVAPPRAEERLVLLIRVLRERKDLDDDLLTRALTALGTEKTLVLDVATAQCPESDERPGTEKVDRVEIREVTGGPPDRPVPPGDVTRVRREVRRRLAGTPAAEMIDEVAVIVPVGMKALAVGAMLAAVDWSVHTAVPLRILPARGRHELARSTVTDSVRDDPDRALAALGPDDLLSGLALDAVRELDLTLAAGLLGWGSARLAPLTEKVIRLQRDAFGIMPVGPGQEGSRTMTSATEIALAPARLRLCGQIVHDLPWDAAYLAASVVDHTFRMPAGKVGDALTVPGVGVVRLTRHDQWIRQDDVETREQRVRWPFLAPWGTVRLRQPVERHPSSELRDWRNRHPLSHGIDQPTEGRKEWDGRREYIIGPSVDGIRGLLPAAEDELRTALSRSYPELTLVPADTLVRRHAELVSEIEQLTQPGHLPPTNSVSGP